MKKVIIRSAALLSLCSCLGIFQAIDISSIKMRDTDAMAYKENVSDENKSREDLLLSGQLPHFGFRNISANLTFLSFLQYFGDDDMRKERGYSLSPDFFELIIADDPYYLDFYIFLSGSVSLKAAQPEKSVELMQEGLALLSPGKPEKGYYIWRYKGVEELLFLGDSKAAQQSFETAAEWARETVTEEGAVIASISQQTVDFLAQNPDSKSAQISAWGSILTTSFDDETRARAITSIQSLGGEVTVNEDGRMIVKYAQAQQESGG